MLSRRINFNGEAPAFILSDELDDIISELDAISRRDVNALSLAAYGRADVPASVGTTPAKLFDHKMGYYPTFAAWGHYSGSGLYFPLAGLTYTAWVDTQSLWIERVAAQSFLPEVYYLIYSNPVYS